MSKLIAILVSLLFLQVQILAQNEAIDEANKELRRVFEKLIFDPLQPAFLYERSVKLTDSIAFHGMHSTVPMTSSTYFQLYSEMRHCAHDTNSMVSEFDLVEEGMAYGKDTIVLSLMELEFLHLKGEAVSTNDYFEFDTLNNQFLDKLTRTSSPYNLGKIFSFAPLYDEVSYSSVVYKIDPNFIFTNTTTGVNYGVDRDFKIDFDDGNGFRSISTSSVNYITIYYTTSGEKILKSKSGKEGGMGIPAKIFIAGNEAPIPADETLDLPGLNVGVYKGCGDPERPKSIIFCEGFDMLDFIPKFNRTQSYNYALHVKSEETRFSELQNFGYDIYVVDWKNSRIDMKYNALYLLNLIEYIKSEKSSDFNDQIVVIGSSMGGVISRYTLTFMESEEYQLGDFSSFFSNSINLSNASYLAHHPDIFAVPFLNRDPLKVSQLHHCRELITIDAPHGGANIPLSLQRLYRKASGILGWQHKYVARAFNLFLDGMVARQLLIYHHDTGLPNAPTPYSATLDRVAFISQLRSFGNYPKYCKKVTAISGSLEGTPQYGNDGFRQALDRLFEFDLTVKARIFWIPFTIYSSNLILRTNPDGGGTYYTATYGFFRFKIKLKLFKVKVNNTYVLGFHDNQIALNMRPYCVNEGGYLGIPNPLTGIANTSGQLFFGLIKYSSGYNNSTSCAELNGSYSFGNFYGYYGQMNFCSDGFGFNFVPTFSALDYQYNSISADHNFDSMNPFVFEQNVPFDVVFSNTNINDAVESNNQYHESFANPLVFNLTRQPNPNTVKEAQESKAYYSCFNNNTKDVLRTLMNMEIGDEELYLENFEVHGSPSFQAEFDIHVNERNPYYHDFYNGNPVINESDIAQKGIYKIYSKTAEFKNQSAIQFYYDQTNSPSSTPGLTIGTTPQYTGSYQTFNIPMSICCNKFSAIIVHNDEQTYKELEGFSKINDFVSSTDQLPLLFPNPVQSHSELNIVGIDEGFHSFKLIDNLGREIHFHPVFIEGLDSYNIKLGGINPGHYFLKITTGDEIFSLRLIVK